MSKKEVVKEKNEEKVMTKYDLKKQKREEAKKKEKKEQLIEKTIWIVVAVALVAFIASFPIRSQMAVKETFVKINGKDISRVEFDYNYYVVKNNYLNTYGNYLSYFGLDATADLSTQMYSDTLTWEDYFEQETVNSMIQGKALLAEAEAAGFTYDVTEDYKEYEEGIKETAAALDVSVGSYVEQAYGPYATMGRIEEFIKESLYINAYYTQVQEDKAPTDDEIQAHYDADKDSYDSVDYYLTVIDAELPTEPTELADPVEETETTEETATEGTETEEEAYQPSEAEIEKAMADAKVLAEAAEATITTDGELKENVKYTEESSLVAEWLFDDARVAGETTIIEHTASNQYYVVSFVQRYLDETLTVNARIIAATDENGQEILDKWSNGEATEESFAALADEYNAGTSYTAEGGYYEAISRTGTQEELATWLFEEGRAAGDTTVVSLEDGTSYVMYYVGTDIPEWKMTIKDEILAEVMNNYVEEISADIEVEDTKGNLEYLAIQAAEEAAAAATEAASDAEATTEEATEATEVAE